ncbi:sigma-54 dependent transcriptional regulator [Prolixibacteraceae bacterium Z1-6]|uniref:Sigma-54 dependent transcriptional regulator n=1 Tax=Draconibacterium aestuarii TaxID=2998507 RepID=A0A9X3J3D1_9BACT|nr:sigma-54 dependent transcriptional regulator [Prolixibacteraceae bacterium Z1-6]
MTTILQVMPKGNILIVDDNKSIISTLEILLGPEFDVVKGITNPNQIPTELRTGDYNLVILDMNFQAGINTGNEGLYWLNQIKKSHPDISVVLITAYSDVELAVNALKQGATDFISKPWDNSKLLATVKAAIQLNFSKKEVGQLKQKEKGLKLELNREQKYIIGSSPQLMKVMKLVRKVAKTNANILITGENGTGKELIAREIHRQSLRYQEVMVDVDMGAISETLFESELFGHVKGAFTDARENRAGKFETANKGTLFLDEIGNLSFHLQAKLLAAIQNREFMRLGSDKPIPVNIRLVCATNKNLEQMVADGLFREDLLYRINTIQIEVPPLRDRGDDIIVLADFFLKKFASKYEKHGLKINQAAQDKLLNYSWPGNIRELQHTVEKAVILSDASVLKPEDFFFKQILSAKFDDDHLTIEEMEKRMILSAIEKTAGNMSTAAEKLGITRQTLYNKIKKYGI